LSVAPEIKCSRNFFLICFFSPKVLIFVYLRAKEKFRLHLVPGATDKIKKIKTSFAPGTKNGVFRYLK